MEWIPGRLLNGIPGAKRVVPNADGRVTPTPTFGANSVKMTHALGKLAQAGVADAEVSGILNLPTATAAVHAEKISHVTDKLTNAGLADDNSPSASASASHSSNGLATKYIIAIVVVVLLVVIVAATVGFIFWRRYRRKSAYKVVSRGVDNKGKDPIQEKDDMFNADLGDADDLETHDHPIGERNFESGYDKVDTGYEGTGYRDGGVDESGGDKRARLEA